MEESRELSRHDSLSEGMPNEEAASSPSLPQRLIHYITEVHRRSGVKLDVARVHTGNLDIDFDVERQSADGQKLGKMDMFSRPRSKSGFQATSPLVMQRRTASEARPKSAYLLNGHCELNASSVKDRHDGYHTDGEDNSHCQLRIPDYQETITQYRRMYGSPMSGNVVDSRYSSASSICSSEDDDNLDSWLSFRKSQSDIGTMRVQPVEQDNSELLEKIKMLEKQNEMLKQQLEDKSMKDTAVQVQQYSVAPIQPIRINQLAPLKFKQQLEDMEGIDSGTQIYHLFMDAERTYVNGLITLVRQFFLPMKMFSACRPHVLPLLQLDAIFLNCEQLMLYHQAMFSAMMRIDQTTDAQISSEFLNMLDKFLPGLTVYTPFLALGQQTFQHEFKSTLQNTEVAQLVSHCEELSETSLAELFENIFQRFDRYKSLLMLFLRLPESNEPREEQVCNMIDYIKVLSKELNGESCDWNIMTAKMKILQSITDSSMLPVELFDTHVHFIKQGNLLHVVGDNEISCVCLLFTTHVALANKTADYKIEIVNPGMMALCGATLYDRVDITGHPLQEDFQTGLRQDQLGFKIQFHNKQAIYMRVSKPSHLREWLQQFGEAISHAHKNCSCNIKESTDNSGSGIDLGPRIAAASLEKLFQQLTNPLNTNREFLETFFMTYRLFTTAEDVLTALINCLLQKNDGSKNRFSDDWEVFSYHSSATNSEDDDEGVEMVCSPSMDTLESINSSSVANCLSEQESPINSAYSSPVMAHKNFVSRQGPRRHKKSTGSSNIEDEPVEAFATARGTVKVKRRFSHDENARSITDTANQKCAIVRASSDSNITHDHDISTEQSQQPSSDSNNSLSDNQQVTLTDKPLPPIVAISLSEDSISVDDEGVKINRQLTSETSQTFSTGSDHYGDVESEGEVVISPDPNGPTPKVSIQQAVAVMAESISTMSNINGNCSNLVSEIMEQFPLLLRSTTAPVISNISQRTDFSHSLPNNLHMVGLEQACSEEHPTSRNKRSNSITGSVESMTSSGNSWLNKAIEGHTLSEIHEDSAESRTSSRSPSPQGESPLRRRADAFRVKNKANITKLGSEKSDTFDRKLAATQETEQARGISRVRPNENGRRGSFLARLLPMRGKGKRHQSDSEALSSSNRQSDKSQLLSVRSSSPASFELSLPASFKPAVSKKTRFPSVLRRKKEIPEPILSPTRDFSLSGGRLSPSPGARYGTNLMHQRSILLSIYSNLNYWIHKYKEDFIYDRELMERLLAFLEEHMQKVTLHDQQQTDIIEDTIYKLKEVTSGDVTDKSLSSMLLKTIQLDYHEEMLSWVEMTDQSLSNATIVNLNPKQLARQLILLEYALYAAIERRELIGCCWKHKNKETEAPNVCRVIKHSNKLTSWVMTAIIQQETAQGRAAAIELFIKVASECLKHNDAQSCVLITCALNSCCVRHDRLKLSWEQVSSKIRQKFDKMVKFSNPDRRCRWMRAHLEKQHPPGVPYTGGYLEHLWAIDNGQHTYTPERLVNFAKMTALSNAVRSFLRFQRESYTFEPDFKLMHYIMAAERLDDEQLYHLSKQREP